MADASGLSAAQKKELKAALETKLAGLTTEIKDLEAELTDENSDGNSAPDEVDRSSFEEEMQRMQLVLDGKKRLRMDVAHALRKFDTDLYGICEETEEPIGYNRLKASPWTRLCIEAQQEFEARRKNSSGGSMGGSLPSYPSMGNSSGGEEGEEAPPSKSDDE